MDIGKIILEPIRVIHEFIEKTYLSQKKQSPEYFTEHSGLSSCIRYRFDILAQSNLLPNIKHITVIGFILTIQLSLMPLGCNEFLDGFIAGMFC